jgi:hypothetical protein
VPESSPCPAEVPSCSTRWRGRCTDGLSIATHQIVDVH